MRAISEKNVLILAHIIPSPTYTGTRPAGNYLLRYRKPVSTAIISLKKIVNPDGVI